jgi:hypothetical protein
MINHHSRYRKLACILAIAGLLTWGYMSISGGENQAAAMKPFSVAMTLLGFAYVIDSVLRIAAERLPIPERLKKMIE